MSKLSENYYLRNYYLETEQVPTQTVMKERMTTPLANVYFKSMTSELKVLAGLEPPIKGGGSDWFVPPGDLLKGRAVMKPIKKHYLKKLGSDGIDFFGDKLVLDHHKVMEEEKRSLLIKSDLKWKETIEAFCSKQWNETSVQEAKQNTANIQRALNEFSILYASSINSIESLLFDAAIKEIKQVEEEAFIEMSEKYGELLKQQATMLYDRWTSKLIKEKERLKEQFITTIENARTELGYKIHDINVKKHIALQKSRAHLECQNLACQVYAAIKEREECKKHLEISKHKHKKAVEILSEKNKLQDFEMKLTKANEIDKQNFIKMWQKKVCCVVKKFQLFVKYCLHTLPEQADFFINMEKLMLLQISEAMDNPNAESIFVLNEPTSHAPVPKPHPFLLYCDKGYKAKLDQDLCPEHCTSSASQFPVIVINKRFIYTACDNLKTFTEKVKQFLDGHHGDDSDLVDDHDYRFDIPFKRSSSEELKEIKFESSLMQVLQNELSIIENIKAENGSKHLEYNKYMLKEISPISPHHETIKAGPTISREYVQEILSKNLELEHKREFNKCIKYITSNRSLCSTKAKNHLKEHLPVYMRKMSPFSEPELPFQFDQYKTCTIDNLKNLVEVAKGTLSPKHTPVKVESKTRDMESQYADLEFDFLCTCFSEEKLQNIFVGSRFFMHESEQHFEIVNGSLSPTDLQRESSFAHDRALSLRRLIEEAPDLEEIFKKKNCVF